MEKFKQKIISEYSNVINFFENDINQLQTTDKGLIRYFKNTGWLFSGKILSMIMSFFVGVYVARYLGPEKYGLLSYASSFAGIFSIFASLGIDNILSRELIKNPEKRDQLLGSSFLIKIVGSIFAILLISITLYFIKSDFLANTLILLYSLSFIISAFGIIDIYFQANVWAQKTVKIQMVSLLISSVLKLIFIYYKFNLIWFMIIFLIDLTILSIGLIFTYKKIGLYISKWKFDYSIIKMLLKNSWPLILSGIAISIYMKIDQIMIKNMIGNEANGIYSVAVRMSEIWYFIPAIICTSLFPAIMNAKKTDPLIYKKRLTRLYSLMIYISVIIAMFMTIFSGFIINYLFGHDYQGSVSVLKIHIWAGISVFLGYAMTQYLIAENYTKIFFAVTLFGAITNVILNIILIPRYGINGSAWATLIAYIVATFSVVFFKEARGQIYLMFKSLNVFKKIIHD